MIIYFNANKTHFHKKGCALGLIFSCSVFVLLVFFGTRNGSGLFKYLGPLFFLLCINDINNASKLAKLILFADGANLFAWLPKLNNTVRFTIR